jgi:hypothetical protein
MPYKQSQEHIYTFPYIEVHRALLSKDKDLKFMAEECRELHLLYQRLERENSILKNENTKLKMENEFLTELINKWRIGE